MNDRFKEKIKNALTMKYWFILPIFSFFISNKILGVVYSSFILIVLSVNIPQCDNNKKVVKDK